MIGPWQVVSMKSLILCDFRSEPGETECHQAVWSQGRSCKRCNRKCYRAGWSKDCVDADNARLVSDTAKGKAGK